MTAISQAAIDLIIREEISSEAYYTKKYEHFDWPEGDSGPTVGIGYDLGYVTESELRADWIGIIDEAMINAMVSAIGLKGRTAQRYVMAHKTSVTITYAQAIRQFREREVPKWIGRTAAPLPNVDHLSPDCFGALLSIAYNRGPSFKKDGDRYAEMRRIHDCMQRGAFDEIPRAIRDMKRLWSADSGLPGRREREAQLFEKGLADCVPLGIVAVAGAPPNSAKPTRLPEITADAGAPAHIEQSAPAKAGWGLVVSVMMLSRTVWATLVAGWLALGDALNWVLRLLPEVKTEIDGSMSAVDSFTSAFKVNKEAIAAVLIAACIATILFRHTRDKVALIKKDAGNADMAGDGGAGARA